MSGALWDMVLLLLALVCGWCWESAKHSGENDVLD